MDGMPITQAVPNNASITAKPARPVYQPGSK